MKKMAFAIAVFLLAFAVPVTVYSILSKESDFDVREEASDEAGQNRSKPQLVSIPVTQIGIGEQYTYKVRAVDSDGDALEYRASKYPLWMTWNEDMSTLDGSPGEEDEGSYEVEIQVNDGKWISTQSFEVTVTAGPADNVFDDDGEDVEGVESVQTQGQQSDASLPGGNEVADSSWRGFVPVDESAVQTTVSQSESLVLGESTGLPKTAVATWILAAGGALGIISVAVFLWADARWNVVHSVFNTLQYERGRQIGMNIGEGMTVRKRKVRI